VVFRKEIDFEGFKIQIDEASKDILPDSFNAPLLCLWEITRNCNLNCIHCYNNSGKKLKNELTHEQKLDVARQIVNAKIFRVCLSGGEPILCKSFWDIAEILTKGKVACSTITNGWYVDSESAKNFSKYFPFVQVSIDGAKQETHDRIRGKKDSFNRAVNACNSLIEAGVKVFISCVANSVNSFEVGEIVDLAYNIGADSFRIDKVRFTGRAAHNLLSLNPSKKQSLYIDKIIKEKQKEYENRMRVEYFSNSVDTFQNHVTSMPNYICYISPSGCCAPDSMLPFSGSSLKEKSLLEAWGKIKNSNKKPQFKEIISQVKSNTDFLKLSKIPYYYGELHDI